MSGAFFFPSAVPGKRRSADCKGLGDSACQNLFLALQPETFLVPDKSSSISSGLPHSDFLAGLCFLMGGFPNIQDIFEGFLPS